MKQPKITNMKSKADSTRLKLLCVKFFIVILIMAFVFIAGVLIHKVLTMDGSLSIY